VSPNPRSRKGWPRCTRSRIPRRSSCMVSGPNLVVARALGLASSTTTSLWQRNSSPSTVWSDRAWRPRSHPQGSKGKKRRTERRKCVVLRSTRLLLLRLRSKQLRVGVLSCGNRLNSYFKSHLFFFFFAIAIKYFYSHMHRNGVSFFNYKCTVFRASPNRAAFSCTSDANLMSFSLLSSISMDCV